MGDWTNNSHPVHTWLWLCLLCRFCHKIFLQDVCLLLNIGFPQGCDESSPGQGSRVLLLVGSSQPFTQEVEHWIILTFHDCNGVLGKSQGDSELCPMWFESIHEPEVYVPPLLISEGYVKKLIQCWLLICSDEIRVWPFIQGISYWRRSSTMCTYDKACTEIVSNNTYWFLVITTSHDPVSTTE